MMGRRQRLIDGAEYDVIYARHIYCYLYNHPQVVREIKRKMNKRMRREQRAETMMLTISELTLEE